MSRSSLVASLAVFLAFGCAGLTPEPVAEMRGRLELSVAPNPIVATPLGGDLYELKFDIVMREAGGVGVRIEGFTVDAVAYGTVTVRSQTYPASFITDRGYPSSIAAGKYLRFSFTKRWTLPTHLLLSGASARVTARTVDENGAKGQSVVRVRVVVPAQRLRHPGVAGLERIDRRFARDYTMRYSGVLIITRGGPMSRIYAGVDLGGTSLIAVIADRKGRVLGSSDCATPRTSKPEETLELIADNILEAAREASVKMKNVAAIGLGAPGAVDPKRGLVVRAPNIGWTDVPAARFLRKRLGPDVILGNDVQVAILGEHAYGAAQGTRRAMGIWVGTGIGGGLIANGEIDRGFRGAAGEIGHMLVKEDGPQCGCGRRGCVEALASRTAMERDVRAASNGKKSSAVLAIMKERGKERMTSSVIARALKAGDPIMKDVLGRAQHYLGLLAGNLVNAFDPEMIVIGGGVAQRLKDTFVNPIADIARTRFLRPDPEHRVRIVHARLGDYSGALGACALAQKRG